MSELKALIAERVMGWKLENISISSYGWTANVWKNEAGKIMVYDREWKPATDISCAWRVVEKLAELGYDVIVSRVLDWRDKYECCLAKDNWRDEDRICKGADTAPLAICLATAQAFALSIETADAVKMEGD